MKKIVLSLFALAMVFVVRAQVPVTFQVDFTNFLAAGGTISANGVTLAGTFNTNGCIDNPADWSPGTVFMTNTTDNIYAITLNFADTSAGDTLLFKFLNNNTWGVCDVDQECSVPAVCSVSADHNRPLALPSTGGTYSAMWDSCGSFTLTSVNSLNAPKVNSLYPNPANGKANLVYTSNVNGKVQIYISNLVGQVIKTVFSGAQTLGLHTQAIDVSGLSNGVYFLTLKVNDQSIARKFNVVN